jgi:aminomethyltransferase
MGGQAAEGRFHWPRGPDPPPGGRFPEKLTGVRLLERACPAMAGAVWRGDRQIGTLTSATFAPSLGTGIGLGYLQPDAWEPGTRVAVEIHHKRVAAETVRGPFGKTRCEK